MVTKYKILSDSISFKIQEKVLTGFLWWKKWKWKDLKENVHKDSLTIPPHYLTRQFNNYNQAKLFLEKRNKKIEIENSR